MTIASKKSLFPYTATLFYRLQSNSPPAKPPTSQLYLVRVGHGAERGGRGRGGRRRGVLFVELYCARKVGTLATIPIIPGGGGEGLMRVFPARPPWQIKEYTSTLQPSSRRSHDIYEHAFSPFGHHIYLDCDVTRLLKRWMFVTSEGSSGTRRSWSSLRRTRRWDGRASYGACFGEGACCPGRIWLPTTISPTIS